MATLKITLKLDSSTVGNNKLDQTESRQATIAAPYVNPSQVSVATGSDTVLLSTSNVQSYVYIKNTDTANYVTVKDNADNTLAVIKAQDFIFTCIPASIGLEVVADTGACVIEYANWATA
jgi:hypothetical protein